jgi:hypothetical protein
VTSALTRFGPHTVPAVSPSRSIPEGRRTGLRGPNGVSLREAQAPRRTVPVSCREGETALFPLDGVQG